MTWSSMDVARRLDVTDLVLDVHADTGHDAAMGGQEGDVGQLGVPDEPHAPVGHDGPVGQG